MGYLNLVDLKPILFNKFCQRIVSIRLILQRLEIIYLERKKKLERVLMSLWNYDIEPVEYAGVYGLLLYSILLFS